MASSAPATGAAFASAVLGVAPYVAAGKLRNIYEIRHYGKDRAISCCVLENTISPVTPGCIRRCTLAVGGYTDKLLRERLVSVTEVGAGAATSSAEDAHRILVELAYVPCGVDERHRAPFPDTRVCDGGPCGVASIRTVCTITRLSHAPNRCFLSMEAAITFDHPASVVGVDDATRLARGHLEREVVAFWHEYLHAVVGAMETAVLAESYPSLRAAPDTDLQSAYDAAEERFCKWAAATGTMLPRAAVVEGMEADLISWSRLLREHRHARMAAAAAESDLAGARRVADEAGRQLAERTAAAEDLKRTLQHLRDSDVQYRELVAAKEAAAALQRTIDEDRRTRQLLVEKHRRAYSSRPGGSEGSGGALVDAMGCAAGAPESAGFRPPAAAGSFQRRMLSSLYTSEGGLCDEQARAIFAALQGSRTTGASSAADPAAVASAGAEGFVTARELAAVVSAADHKGLYEEVDESGALAAPAGGSARRSVAADERTPALMANVSAADDDEVRVSCSAAFTTATEAQASGAGAELGTRARALAKLAEDTVNRYAFREAGRLYYDEFCLALMHIVK